MTRRCDRRGERARRSDRGSFIWYELMTTDAGRRQGVLRRRRRLEIVEASREFPNGYRMIGRSDGEFAGGVLPLTDEMQQHGARPTWLGYIYVETSTLRSRRSSRPAARR